MKKIISALALASLTFGAAFADASMSLNYRTQGMFYTTDTVDNYNDFLSNRALGGTNDDVKLTAANDIATVEFSIGPAAESGGNLSQSMYQYDAFVNIGKWEIGAGFWKNGKYTGAYQVKQFADNTNCDGNIFAFAKLGSLFKNRVTTAVDNLTGGENYAGYVTWGDQLGKAKLLLSGALIAGGNFDGSSSSGFIGKADIMWNNNFDHQIVYKAMKNSEYALAYHVQPYCIPYVNMTVGGALGITNALLSDYNVDFRVRYQKGAIDISMLTNFSWINPGTQTKTNIADVYSKPFGAYGAHQGTTTNSTILDGTNKDKSGARSNIITATKAFQGVIGLRYKLSDHWYPFMSTGALIGLSDFENEGMELFVAPGIQYVITGKSSIMSYIRLGFSNIGATANKADTEAEVAAGDSLDVIRSINIPFIMRIRF